MTTLFALLSLRIASTMNLLFYYVQKLPLLGRLVKDSLYANQRFKKWISVIVQLLMILWALSLRFLYVGFIIYLPVSLLASDWSPSQQWQLCVHILVLISFITAGTSSATILEPKREKYVAVRLMRMNPKAYMRITLTYRYVTFFIYLAVALFPFSRLLEASYGEAVLLSFILTLWRCICEYAHLKLYEKTGIILIKQLVVVWIVIIAGFAVAYLPLLLQFVPPTYSIIEHWSVIIPIIVLGCLVIVLLAKYPNYREVVEAATKRDDPLLDLGRMMTEAQQKDLKTKDSDLASATGSEELFQHKTGYAYLHALFVARHKSLIQTPFFKRLAIIAIAGTASIFLGYWLPTQNVQWMKLSITQVTSFLFIIMFFLTVGERLCRAMFYHCDISLLRYSFYRQSSFEHFRLRFKLILKQNMLVALLLGLALTLFGWASSAGWHSVGWDFSGWNAEELIVIWTSVISLALFFSTHHLCLYYLVQPYSTEMNVRNPLYHVLSFIVSGFSGACIFLPIPPIAFAIAICAIALIYVIATMVLIRNLGHKTLQVK